MLQLAIIIVLLLCFEFVQGQEYDLETQCTKVTRNGRKICAYMSIPYAEPPVGPYRFKNPIPHQWMLEFSTTDPNQCPQFNDAGVLVGDEDCLYLNVYGPEEFEHDTKRYPVMVYFHGGNFVKGSARSMDAGPEYLLDRDIILVTVNYRLGLLGFLSTGDAAAPGNFGLKDQVVALQWVQTYIADFYGDPKRVTIFGEGAGGISTSLHAISSASDGLFHKYISQSGNIVSPASTRKIETYKNRAVSLGKHLNCSMIDSEWIILCLRCNDLNSLMYSNDIFKTEFWTISSWGPTKEPNLPGAFLTFNPEDEIAENPGRVKPLPAIFGNVANEGLKYTVDLLTNDTLYDIFVNRIGDVLQYLAVNYVDEEFPKAALPYLYDYYLHDIDSSDKEAFIKAFTDLITDYENVLASKFQLFHIQRIHRNTPFYLYKFDYRGTLSHTSLKTGDNKDIGVTHGDDLIYLFPPSPELKNASSSSELSETDGKMIDIMIDLWTSFAYTGKPTSSHIPDPNVWQVYGQKNINYLQIGNDTEPTLTTVYQMEDDAMDIWWNIDNDIFYLKHYDEN